MTSYHLGLSPDFTGELPRVCIPYQVLQPYSHLHANWSITFFLCVTWWLHHHHPLLHLLTLHARFIAFPYCIISMLVRTHFSWSGSCMSTCLFSRPRLVLTLVIAPCCSSNYPNYLYWHTRPLGLASNRLFHVFTHWFLTHDRHQIHTF